MTPGEVSTKILEILDQRGWCQGRFQNKDRQVCLMAAAYLALAPRDLYSVEIDSDTLHMHSYSYDTDSFHRWWGSFHAFLDTALGEDRGRTEVAEWKGVAEWNDLPTTTQEDVRLMLKRHVAEAG